MSNLKISDHALLRLIDHAGDVSVEAMRERLHASLLSAVNAVHSMGSADFTISHGGLTYVLRNEGDKSVLVTVINRTRTDGSRKTQSKGTKR